jgi:glucose/arabinose dehydrogenase/chitodextrinase
MLACSLWLAFAAAARATPQPPVITEPSVDGETISAFDVHMVAGPFVGAPGETHVCTDWEIRTIYSDTVVWTAPCVTGATAVHIHLGDGTFVGLLAGRNQLNPASQYKLRVRFKGSDPPPDGTWSDWSSRLFNTLAVTQPEPLVLSDVASIAAPRWRDGAGADVLLPAGDPAPSLVLEAAGGDASALDERRRRGRAREPSGSRVARGAPRDPLRRRRGRDASGDGRDLHGRRWHGPRGVPARDDARRRGRRRRGGSRRSAPPSPTRAAARPARRRTSRPRSPSPPVPWAVRQPGFRVERVATGLTLPVNIAFVPSPSAGRGRPVLLRHGALRNDRHGDALGRGVGIRDRAAQLRPDGPVPRLRGEGADGNRRRSAERRRLREHGLRGPEPGRLPLPAGASSHERRRRPDRVRLDADLHFDEEPQGASHQISHLSFGPDGNLYVHVGDGLLTTPAQDIDSVRGKILRVTRDGAAPSDNPFYDASDGLTEKDLVYAWGFRNPFGGAWREADGKLWEVENGPSVDRIARVDAGVNYGWDGTDASMHTNAAFVWSPAVAPVNIAWIQPGTFGGSGFPAEKADHLFASESGGTYGEGPTPNGKRISEFVFDAAGTLVTGPAPLIEYAGVGRGTVVGLAAGPDGLYFTDLYKDFGAASPIEAGASVFRVRWTGVADFTAEAVSGTAPLAVAFHPSATVPSPTAWHWEFGDGGVSDEQEPVHEYLVPGVYDVRLTVTGSGGAVVRQKPAFVEVAQPIREELAPAPNQRPPTRLAGPRP